ncbi:serine hydrolase domain-containing protein [Gordonia sp. CPCC 205333]|uniref:serine hydrolase domain-containing protein n=1 Tax=Gordonia sp. CPCC 205333 TaxID=3140790 RepID=UPI003AF35B68
MHTVVSGYSDRGYERLTKVFGRVWSGGLGGGALAVFDNGVPVVDIWCGNRDARGEQPWTESTAAVIYSASKGLSSIVIHRLADRGLIDYDNPVAEYWPDFAAEGKSDITVRQVLSHTAGLSALSGMSRSVHDALDHELMQRRLASSRRDELAGKPAYHALTIGWLLAGIAKHVTGKDMRTLYQDELCAPLGLTQLSLGTPRPPVQVADYVDPRRVFTAVARDNLLARGTRFPAALGGASCRALYMGPGTARMVATSPEKYLTGTQMPAANAISTARDLGRVYAALATDGRVGADRLLSAERVRMFDGERRWQRDRVIGLPMSWNLGFHRSPVPGLAPGFGHVGLSGCFGWADVNSGLSVGFVHNRLPSTLVGDLGAFLWLVPLALRGQRAARRLGGPGATATDMPVAS